MIALKKDFSSIYFSQVQTMTMPLSYDNSTAIFTFLKPYNLAGFELRIFCSVCGRDDHYATPPGLKIIIAPTAMRYFEIQYVERHNECRM
jgi:hypothetical protein